MLGKKGATIVLRRNCWTTLFISTCRQKQKMKDVYMQARRSASPRNGGYAFVLFFTHCSNPSARARYTNRWCSFHLWKCHIPFACQSNGIILCTIIHSYWALNDGSISCKMQQVQNLLHSTSSTPFLSFVIPRFNASNSIHFSLIFMFWCPKQILLPR